MKIKRVICLDCRNEEKREFFTSEEAMQKRISLGGIAPCKKCGSQRVKILD